MADAQARCIDYIHPIRFCTKNQFKNKNHKFGIASKRTKPARGHWNLQDKNLQYDKNCEKQIQSKKKEKHNQYVFQKVWSHSCFHFLLYIYNFKKKTSQHEQVQDKLPVLWDRARSQNERPPWPHVDDPLIPVTTVTSFHQFWKSVELKLPPSFSKSAAGSQSNAHEPHHVKLFLQGLIETGSGGKKMCDMSASCYQLALIRFGTGRAYIDYI